MKVYSGKLLCESDFKSLEATPLRQKCRVGANIGVYPKLPPHQPQNLCSVPPASEKVSSEKYEVVHSHANRNKK